MTDMEYEIREEEMLDVEEEEQPQRQRRLKSTVVSTRAYDADTSMDIEETGRVAIEHGFGGSGPARSVEGWVIFVSGVHEEATEEDIQETFGEFGDIKNIYFNLERQTGYAKGYALVEYELKDEAMKAIQEMDGQEFMTKQVMVTWAFGKGPIKQSKFGRSRDR
eukprot:TRINITY_DN3297_c0_g4_i1.p3 TRINITY_DN3297_c0_g4~~TRINITY_DN3297_c0_g4_i1.p3  ORF type:complete len:164 (-),score=29.68 TRINITY_DN3297_c0_g4_i1:469-960(-)